MTTAAAANDKVHASANTLMGSIWSVVHERGLRVGDQLPSNPRLPGRVRRSSRLVKSYIAISPPSVHATGPRCR